MTRISSAFHWTGLATGLLISLVMLAGCQPNPSDSESTDRPNIIFIFMDDQASHSISAYGSELVETPNMDRLANEGIRFDQAFVTNSICAPSRAVLLTGVHSHINGKMTNQDTFDGSQITYPKLLGEAGYQTAMIGKWHLRSLPTGYDHWDILPGQGAYYNPDFINEGGEYRVEGYVTDIITDKVIDWIDQVKESDEPFMVNYHHKAPHRNWMPGPDHLNAFEGTRFPEPSTLYANWSNELGSPETEDLEIDEWSGRTSAVRTQRMTLMDHFDPAWDLKLPLDQVEDAQYQELWANAYGRFNEEQREAWDAAYDPVGEEYRQSDLSGRELQSWLYQRYMNDYMGTLLSVDDNLGRLLEYLEQSGLDENTIVIFTSDQGFFLGDHGWYDKRWMYEQSLHIPLMVRWPGVIEPGQTDEHMVQNLDFAPTLVDLAGLEIPDWMQGKSLLPIFRGESPENWRESIYYHYYEHPSEHSVERHYGVRTDRYKLIHYYQIGEWELFDLEKDPDEMQSVHEDPDYEQIRNELETELERLREQYRVPEEDPV